MSERVDVLAVIDWLIADSAQFRAQPGRGANRIGLSLDAKRARAAVAELIEAIESDAAAAAYASGLGVSEWRAFVPARTFAALARVGDAS